MAVTLMGDACRRERGDHAPPASMAGEERPRRFSLGLCAARQRGGGAAGAAAGLPPLVCLASLPAFISRPSALSGLGATRGN